MAQESPSAVGADTVRGAYGAMFGGIALDIRFEIPEIRALAPQWAFARTTSTGTIQIKATGAQVPVANQELVIFQKVDGTWKIARHCLSTTFPGRA
jgi:ketosteroid isomerase-like protein